MQTINILTLHVCDLSNF